MIRERVTADPQEPLDFRALFEAAPSPNLVLRAEPPYVIVAANDAYLAATMTTRAGLIGRAIFDAFPDNPDDPGATGVRMVRESIEHVVAHRRSHTMAVQKYDVPRPGGDGFEERYWSPIHVPLFGPDGRVAYVIQRPENVTEFVRLKARAGEQDRRAEELRDRAEQVEAEVFARARELAQANAALLQQVQERQRAEAALAREQDFLRAVLDNAADGIVACDADGKPRFFNLAARELLGPAGQSPASERWAQPSDLYLSDGKTRMSKEQVPLFRALADGRIKDVEMVIAADGQPPRLLTANGRAITDADGRKLGAVVVMHDLTARKQAEEQRERAVREEAGRKGAEALAERLRESEERFRLMADAVPQIVWITDGEGRVEFFNQQWTRYTGLDHWPATADDVTATLLHPDDRPATVAAFDAAKLTGETFAAEHRIRSAAGDYRWFLVRGEPHRDPRTGRIARWYGASVDIHDRKLAEAGRERLLEAERAARAEAERAGRMKDEFLATLSHELRTPLNAILGWSQIVRRSGSDPATLAEGLTTIERNARSQAQIIDDLLDMSRIVSGKVRLEVRQVDLAAVVGEAIATVRPAAEVKGVRLEAELGPHASPVSGDPARLQQVMWNLLSNAAKFTPKGGDIRVRLERVASNVEVVVSDSGEGIKPEFLPHVFDRFRQADASTTRRHGGLGLGLSIVKQLVELHGGSIVARSAGPGQGASFTLSLPLTTVRAETGPDAERHRTRAVPSSNGASEDRVRIADVKVLVVDDEPDGRAVVKRLLEDRGARVVTAGSAAEALDLVEAERPDVLVSDIGMPGEDGYEFIKKVRTLGPEAGGRTPAVALTAYAHVEDRVKAVTAGFDMHVAKPIEPAELIAIVGSLSARER